MKKNKISENSTFHKINQVYPVIKNSIEKMNFSESKYKVDGESYDAPTLYRFAEEKKYKPFDLPLAAINLDQLPFTLKNLDEFIFQMNRVMNTDKTKSIILDNYGRIADGYHRICKAILDGDQTIKAIRLEEMPYPSGTDTYEQYQDN